MTKSLQTPGSVLTLFLRGYQLNPTNLAKQIKLSQATVRLITLDKTRISAPAALRLAKFFKMKPAYWLDLQSSYDLAQAEANPKLKKILAAITTAKKPSAAGSAKAKAKTQTAKKRGRAAAKPRAKTAKTKRVAKKK